MDLYDGRVMCQSDAGHLVFHAPVMGSKLEIRAYRSRCNDELFFAAHAGA